VKAFVARPAAIAAAIRKHHAGDIRAFEVLERAGLQYDFGQQVLPDGRVMGAKDSFRQASTPDLERGSAPVLPIANPNQPQPNR
ncbi:hypothetical protein, partial [Escherichia coli]|uniref:hypothetical protein n=1 Tax=Escherichia coli TaxID=562 RepID=UPI00159BD910